MAKHITYIAFWAVAILWLATALPILGISLLSLEIPLWPSFGPESTLEGRLVWAAVAGWFYLIPIVLFLLRKYRRPAPRG